MISVPRISPYTSFFAFLVGLPTLVGTYYQAWKARQESRQARQGFVYSENCLEFILEDGTTINLVPLETLHTLPKPGDIVLLPGTGEHNPEQPQHAAYTVKRVEYIYTRVENKQASHGQARLAKAVAHVNSLSEMAGQDFFEAQASTSGSALGTVSSL
jgi:hypothetical protein